MISYMCIYNNSIIFSSKYGQINNDLKKTNCIQKPNVLDNEKDIYTIF